MNNPRRDRHLTKKTRKNDSPTTIWYGLFCFFVYFSQQQEGNEAENILESSFIYLEILFDDKTPSLPAAKRECRGNEWVAEDSIEWTRRGAHAWGSSVGLAGSAGAQAQS